jgi:hypothetical protein
VILVKLDAEDVEWAEQAALPVFQQVAQDTVQIMKIEPDDRMPSQSDDTREIDRE